MDVVQIESEQISDQVFKMYNGPAVDITIEFKDKLIGGIQDKFGEDTNWC